MNINHKQMERLIKLAYQRKQPIYVWGATGIGKSMTIKRVAKEIAKEMGLKYNEDISKINEEENFSVVDIRISQLDPPDLRGLPKIDNGNTRWLPPNWLPRKSKGIIFFDELNLAPPSIQASAYQLILDRRLGEYILPEGWIIISAGNRLEDRANVFELPAPLKNRFCHITLNIPSIEEWTLWASENGIDSRIVAFLNFKPSLLFRFDPENKEQAFPTPRSWEFASKMIRGMDVKDEMFEVAVASAVGQGTAIEFQAFCKLNRKINVDDIIRNPKKIKEIKEIDLKYSVIGALADRYRKDRKLLKAMVVLSMELEPEFGMLLLRMVKGVDERNFSKIRDMKEYRKIVRRFAKYVL